MLAPLLAAALAGSSVSFAQVNDPAGASPSTSTPVVAADSSTGGTVEPEPLPGNLPVALTEQLPTEADAAAVEPPLPVAEDPETAAEPSEPAVDEVSATPRRFRYAISVEARGVYDDNVTLSRNENRREDFSAQIEGRVVFGIGDVLERQANYVSFSYSPTAYFYINNSEFNTLEHIAHLEGRWRPGRFAFTLSQDFTSVQSTNLGVINESGGFNNQANLDVGGRRRVTTYSTRFGAAADLTGKTSFTFGAQYSLVDPEDLIGSETLAGSIGFNYQLGPKLSLGVDLSVGQNFVEGPSPDQTFEQLTVRASYEISEKLRANGSAGFEFRQSEVESDDQVSPIFQLGMSYKPFDGTSFGASATRRTLNSASVFGQDFTSTQVTFNAQQRFFQRAFLSLSTGYQHQTYFSRISGVAADREDDYYFVVPGIDVRVTKFWFAGIYYVSRQNDSSLEFFSFDDNQFGFRSNLQF
ncbi:MAG TPA: hypothetical protein VK993_12940 [Chthoniobacterales bacterium]|nr:hypothetical protein [Chthoniobacterales bacterium]